MSTKLTNILKLVLAIFFVYLVALTLRIGIYKDNLIFPKNLFTQECAFHYYFTKLVAEKGALPDIDYKIQSPEGFKVFRSESVVMEYVAGYLYRIFFRSFDFDRFISYFVMFFSSISSIAVILTAYLFYKNNITAALFSGIFYAVSWPSVARSIGLVYLKENFAFPIIFFHIYFLVRFLHNKKKSELFISSILLYLAFASWHFTKFYFLILSLYSLWKLLGNDNEYFKAFFWFMATGILASFTIPFLRENMLIFSYPFCLGYATLFVKSFFKSRKKELKVLLAITIFISLIAVTFPFSKEMVNYSHVYKMIFYKLKFFDMKPLNPSLMPFEVRQLWVKPFHLPEFKSFMSDFLILVIFSIIPIIYFIRKLKEKKLNLNIKFFLYLLFMAFLMYLLSARLRSFFVFFISVLSGGIFFIVHKKKFAYIALILSIFFCTFLYLNNSSKKIVPLSSTTMPEVIGWIKDHTDKSDIFLSMPFNSTEICAYADRAIILHPKYETKIIRDKIQKFSEGLFSDSEEDFFNLCKAWKVTYFMFPKGTSIKEDEYSWRYFSDRMELNKSSNAFKFEALPELSKTEKKGRYSIIISTGFDRPNFKHFELVFKNKDFNIYKVIY